MTASGSNIIIFTVYLSFIFHPNHGFTVIQPQNRTVNPDGSAFIICEHTESQGTVEDVRLNGISRTDKSSQLCQKEQECENIVLGKINRSKWVFTILNVGREAMDLKYECEFTVTVKNLDYTKKGTPTTLLPGSVCVPHPSPPPPTPPLPQSVQLRWILIGLLALMFLYSCVITSFYIRLKSSSTDPENSTYVVMRKAPLPKNPSFDFYCA